MSDGTIGGVKRPRQIKLRLAVGFCIVLAAATVVLWVNSNKSTIYLGSIARTGNRFTLKCSEGKIILAGPPPEDVKDPIAADLVAQMSREDFEWKYPVLRNGVWHAWVQAKEGSPTSLLFRRFGYRKTTDPGMAAAYRQWLAALDDPRRYFSAHLLFLISFDQWREGNSDWSGPYQLIPLDASGKPQVPDQRQVLRRWHDQTDVAAVQFSLAWLLGVTLILPLLWLSRPRPVRAIALRWAFNLCALLTAILFLTSTVAWIRSEWVAELWNFPIRDGAKLTSSDGTAFATFLFRSIISERGKLQWSERSVAQLARFSARGMAPRSPPAYRKSSVSRAGLVAPAGQSRFYVPGIQIDITPPQSFPPTAMRMPVPANPAAVLLPSTPIGPPDPRMPTTMTAAVTPPPVMQTVFISGGFRPGTRSVIVSWWLVALLFAICPMFWLWATWRRWRRLREQGSEHLCPVCFYDLRATPDRCPECGTAVSAARPRALPA